MNKSGTAASSLPRCKYFDKMKFLYEETKNQPTESDINFSACEPASPTPGSGA